MQSLKNLFAPRDMTEGKPWKNLLIFVVPMLIGNVVQQLYNTVDAIVVGRYVGDNALAAVGSTTSLFFLLLVLFIGISSGAGIMVSQYFGAKKREELSHTIGACITTLTAVSLVLTVFAPMVTRPLMEHFLQTPAAILDDGVLYLNILLWGVLGVAYYNILTGILRGLGDSFSSLLYLVIACLLNIALDLLFVAVFNWGVAGAAIATVIAQFVSGFMCLRRLMKMRDVYNFGLKYLKPKKEYIKQIVKLGMPTGISQAVFSMAMVLVQSLINSFGEVFIAVNVIVMRIDSFVMMPNFTFGAAMMVFTGQNMGAGKLDRVIRGRRQCAFMAVGTAAVIVTLMMIFGRPLAGLFTDTAEIINSSVTMLGILAAGYVVFAFGQTSWSVITGAGDTVTPMWVSICTVVILRVPLAYLMVHFLKTPESLFYSMLVSWTVNSSLGYIMYRIGKWKTKGIIKEANSSL